MEREFLEQRLLQTEQELADIEERIGKQREIIAELQRDGLSTTLADEIVDVLLRTRARHEGTRDRLRKDLGYV
jgi:hypothetical protein